MRRVRPNPLPLVALFGGVAARRFIVGTLLAGGAFLVGKTVLEGSRTVTTVGESVRTVVPMLTYATAGIIVYNMARKGKPF